MKDALVGCTGFVGSNIVAKHEFEGLYNSKNIGDAYGTKPDLLVYAGLPSAMYLANNFPAKDGAAIDTAKRNIQNIAPKTIVLISTVAVYDNPVGVDESAAIDVGKLTTYGKNRRLLEIYVEENFKNHLIVRLPALFGKNLKKNFIYDFIHLIPATLTEAKFNALCGEDGFIQNYYTRRDDGFYTVRDGLDGTEKARLKAYFRRVDLSALNFTDSRSVYQFYNLSHLWEHMEVALAGGIPILNAATEPLCVAELYHKITGKKFDNTLPGVPYNYDIKTRYDYLFGQKNGYIENKDSELKALVDFIQSELEKTR